VCAGRASTACWCGGSWVVGCSIFLVLSCCRAVARRSDCAMTDGPASGGAATSSRPRTDVATTVSCDGVRTAGVALCCGIWRSSAGGRGGSSRADRAWRGGVCGGALQVACAVACSGVGGGRHPSVSVCVWRAMMRRATVSRQARDASTHGRMAALGDEAGATLGGFLCGR